MDNRRNQLRLKTIGTEYALTVRCLEISRMLFVNLDLSLLCIL